MAKPPAKKAASSKAASSAKPPARPSRPKKARALLAPGAVILTVNEKDLQSRAEQCLRESGKITLSVKEISVSQIGGLADAEVIVN